MRSSILPLVFAATILGSCSTLYRTGQTPDDVYFSPERQHDEYVNVKDNDNSPYYENDDEYYDDQYLRMKVHNRLVWSTLDDPYFYNPAFSYGYSYYNSWYWNNPWNPYTYWNYSYNPYCSVYYPVILPSKMSFAYNHPRMFNLNTYNPNAVVRPANSYYTHGIYNNGYGNYNNNGYNRPVRIGASNSNSNINTNTGNFLRNIFNNSSSSNNNSSNSNPGRTTNSSSSSSSGSSGSSGGTAPVRRF